MELFFLGTSAGVPTTERNVSAVALNPRDQSAAWWLFDCGEATQHQILRSPLSAGKIEKIFITHLHGDHLFGLPGLLCSRSMAGSPAPLDIYGPPGIKAFVEMALQISGSWTGYPLAITEIGEGVIFDDGQLKVSARALNHPLLSFGFRIEQAERPGTLDAAALMQAGVAPGPLFQRLKRGEAVQLEDGRMIDGADYLGAAQKGKSLAIFGDTAPTPAALALAKDVDLLVHETTLEAAMAEKANSRGHSTTAQAAMLAREANVGRLVMTHFSSRYDLAGCQRLLAECQAIFPASELAADFCHLTL
ncbi:ribonuclease Z [Entomohabitans teleogrylli]|uniref:ribonuclease Z n=1 Tax=Entomohabitans teleogrylli TaxID=1384589 RepID=UPI00073D6FF5|nr:ribonuclease Z [Entomohabitans teleogrylli]